MASISLPNGCRFVEKDGIYKKLQESVYEKLQHAATIADIGSTHDCTNDELFRLLWCLSDLLSETCEKYERLIEEGTFVSSNK